VRSRHVGIVKQRPINGLLGTKEEDSEYNAADDHDQGDNASRNRQRREDRIATTTVDARTAWIAETVGNRLVQRRIEAWRRRRGTRILNAAARIDATAIIGARFGRKHDGITKAASGDRGRTRSRSTYAGTGSGVSAPDATESEDRRQRAIAAVGQIGALWARAERRQRGDRSSNLAGLATVGELRIRCRADASATRITYAVARAKLAIIVAWRGTGRRR